MDDSVSAFRLGLKAATAAGKAVDAAVKAAGRVPADPAALQDAASKAAAALEKVSGLDAAAGALRRELSARADAARTELERERALLAGAVASALQATGLAVAGNLPLLAAGPFSLEFVFGAKGACTIWLGPRKQKLAACPLEATAIAARVAELDAGLFGAPLDEAAFLAELARAYRMALARSGGADGDRVPLSALMAEVAFGRQDAGFLADPRREHFASFGRVEFSCCLGRLHVRRAGGRELRLDVATMAQTRRPEDHLWVPRGRAGDGVNYATAHFVRADAG
jgi:hypothetical protein